MPGPIRCNWSFPGVTSIEIGTYTASHGTSPGKAIIKMGPQGVLPDKLGDLVISDGSEGFPLIGCVCDALKLEHDDDSFAWSIEVLDRRWRWKYGKIEGCYNQLDPFGKLIPQFIRSPMELATLCLNAMGETCYQIDMPPGINYPGPRVTQPIINTSGVNPPVNWSQGLPPAQALQQLCDLFGRRIVFQPVANRVIIAQLGTGADLPADGSIHQQGPSIKSPEVPDSIGVVGAATRFQTRLRMIAVGEDWDGNYREINYLSYAPQSGAAAQVNKVVTTCTAAGAVYKLWISADPATPVGTGFLVQYVAQPGDTAAIVAAALAAALNAGFNARPPLITPAVGFVQVGGTITFTGPVGVPFGIAVQVPGGGVTNVLTLTQTTAAAKGGPDWTHEYPEGGFWGVKATDRLTFVQAQALARKSVYKFYNLCNIDASGKGPIQVPGYGGRIDRSQQIILTDAQVDQITPQPNDALLKGQADGQPINVNFYNGYSKDKPAVALGIYAAKLAQNQGLWSSALAADLNEPYLKNGDFPQIMTPFTVDAERWTIKFADYVYYQGEGVIYPCSVYLQCAVMVRNADTNQVEAFTKVLPLPGQNAGTATQWKYCPDVQLNVTSTYTPATTQQNNAGLARIGVAPFPKGNRILTATVLEADPIQRANYYLAGMLKQFDVTAGQTLDYNGIRAIDLDGAITQVTWATSSSEHNTVASRNAEHDFYVPPYRERRRAEFLSPNKQAAIDNANQNARINVVGPPAP